MKTREEIFTIGDFTNNGTISEFRLQNNELRVFFKEKHINYHVNLNTITHRSKTPLFTTEDGVGVLGGDKYYWVCIHNEGWNAHKAELGFNLDSFSIPQNVKTFSTPEKAEEYILLNKPCLSVNEIIAVIPGFKFHKEILIAKAKSKL